MQKKTIIKRIRAIIEEFGSFNTGDVYADSSPIISSFGNNGCELAEDFKFKGVTAISYANDREVDERYIDYENLTKDTLEEILLLAEAWEADQIQTEKRISN